MSAERNHDGRDDRGGRRRVDPLPARNDEPGQHDRAQRRPASRSAPRIGARHRPNRTPASIALASGPGMAATSRPNGLKSPATTIRRPTTRNAPTAAGNPPAVAPGRRQQRRPRRRPGRGDRHPVGDAEGDSGDAHRDRQRHQAGSRLGVARPDRRQPLEDHGEGRGEADEGGDDPGRDRLRRGVCRHWASPARRSARLSPRMDDARPPCKAQFTTKSGSGTAPCAGCCGLLSKDGVRQGRSAVIASEPKQSSRRTRSGPRSRGLRPRRSNSPEATAFVRRRSGRTRTRHPQSPAIRLDCFAALAMTGVGAVARRHWLSVSYRSSQSGFSAALRLKRPHLYAFVPAGCDKLIRKARRKGWIASLHSR